METAKLILKIFRIYILLGIVIILLSFINFSQDNDGNSDNRPFLEKYDGLIFSDKDEYIFGGVNFIKFNSNKNRNVETWFYDEGCLGLAYNTFPSEYVLKNVKDTLIYSRGIIYTVTPIDDIGVWIRSFNEANQIVFSLALYNHRYQVEQVELDNL